MKRKNSVGAVAVVGIGVILYIILLVAFAYQTWELVDWLFPKEQVWMKIAGVFAFDLMAGFWAALDMFYPFKKESSRHITQIMWFVSFLLATAASGIEMYMGATDRLGYTLNPDTIKLAYGLVIVALIVQLATMTFVLRSEWGAYIEGGEEKPARPVPSTAPRPLGPPPARAALAQQGEVKAPLTKPEPKEEA